MLRLKLSLFVVLLATTAVTLAQSPAEFQLYTTYWLGQQAQTAAIGDLNGDGRDDVAVAAWPSTLFVLYQQADGTLGAPVQFLAPNRPLGIAIGDINKDGRKDLAVGGTGGAIFLYYQKADGTLGNPITCSAYNVVNGLVIDDLNADGLPDIAASVTTYAGTNYPGAFVFLQNAAGGFGLPSICRVSGGNARCITTFDYNLDGLRDIALLLDDKVCYLTRNPSGGYDAPQYLSALGAHSMASGDVTGDGLDDLVFTVSASRPYSIVGVYAHDDAASPAVLSTYPAYDYPQPLVLADIDGDGRKDVVTAHGGFDNLALFHQTVSGTLDEWEDYLLPSCSSYQQGALAAGDLNSDGCTDIALADSWNGLVVLLHTKASDSIPPVCSAVLSGTLGLDGWYVSPVEVTLSADDGADGSGVKQISYTLDGANWLAYSAPVAVSAEGLTHFGYYAEDAAGNRSDTQWIEIKIDTLAPKPAQAASGTLGLNGWYISPVSVGLAADDAGGSGVAKLMYTTDGSNWLAYSDPIAIVSEGVTKLGCYAEDVAGNRSEVQWVEVKIDTQAPSLTLVPSVTTLWPPNGATVNVAIDAAGADQTSGLASLHLMVVDEYGLVQPEMDVTASPVLVPLVVSRNDGDKDGRVYTLILTGTDAAGNAASVQANITVPHGHLKKPKKERG